MKPSKEEHITEKTEETITDVQHNKPADDTAAPLHAHEIHGVGTGKPIPKWQAFLKTKKGKIVAVLAAVVVIVVVLFAVPTTRYAMAGLVIKKDVTVLVTDNQTGKPISDAQLNLNGKNLKTDNTGKATFTSVPVGPITIKADKKYYEAGSVGITVPIISPVEMGVIKLQATGRQVPVTVLNKISGKPVANAALAVLDTSVKTNEEGKAIIVLPADKATEKAAITLDGYNSLEAEITVTEREDTKNTFSIAPAGKIFFLSKRTGKINVMKSNLDGTNPEIVVAGTGKEDEGDTVLLAARDWSYLALRAKRDSDKPKLYLIDTATSKLTVIDEGDATFTPVGWHNDQFIYTVLRHNVQVWQPKQAALKSFNAKTAKLTILDETAGEGTSAYDYTRELIDSVYILDNEITYVKAWNTYFNYAGKLSGRYMQIVSVKPTGEGKHTVKQFPEGTDSFIRARLYKPGEIYYYTRDNGADVIYEYEHGKFEKITNITPATFDTAYYPTYLLSPSGQATFWYEPRDGKNTLLIGNAGGEDQKELTTLSDFKPYGWHGNDYVLMSKGGSELFIAWRDDAGLTHPLKITDYHKPSVEFFGYGYGYGGL